MIADHVGVSVDLVGRIRTELSENDSSSPAAIARHQPRRGKDGKVRQLPHHQVQPTPAPEALHITKSDQPQEVKGKPKIQPKTQLQLFTDVDTWLGKVVRGVDDIGRLSDDKKSRDELHASLNVVLKRLFAWKGREKRKTKSAPDRGSIQDSQANEMPEEVGKLSDCEADLAVLRVIIDRTTPAADLEHFRQDVLNSFD